MGTDQPIKAIMVDVDGVLIVHPDPGGWSANLERDLGIQAATLHTAFFERHWDDVVNGRAALKERLTPVLSAIAPQVTCDQLIAYWFDKDAHLNDNLLAELASIRANGIEMHLATVQEHERAQYLWENLDFRAQFDGLHYAAAIGSSKPAADFYKAIEASTGFRPHELFFIDDKISNVEGAIACGWSSALWTGSATLASLLSEHGRVGPNPAGSKTVTGYRTFEKS